MDANGALVVSCPSSCSKQGLPRSWSSCSRLSPGELRISKEGGFSTFLGTHRRLGGPNLPLAASTGEAVRKPLMGDAKP